MTSGRGAVPTRHLGTVLVVLAVVLAGCVGGIGGGDGGGNGDGASPTTATTGTDGPDGTSGTDGTTQSDGTDGTTSGTATGGTGSTATTTDAGGGAFGDDEFSEGDTFRYSAALTNTSSRISIRWRVTDVSGEELTVELSWGYDGSYGEPKTFEGTEREVFEQLSFESDHLGEVIFLSLRIGPSIAEGRSLSVGNSWTGTAEDLPPGVPTTTGSFRVEVTGTGEYAGVECTNIRVSNTSESDGEGSATTYCVNPEYPFSLASNAEGAEGTGVRFEGTSTDGGGGTGETTTTTSTDRGLDVTGTADSDVDGLRIVDHRLVVGEGDAIGEGALGAAVTVENTGDRTADVLVEYSYRIAIYDESGAEIVSGFTAGGASRSDPTLAPGESVELVLIVGAYDPDRVDGYEVTLTCRDSDEGAYCE